MEYKGIKLTLDMDDRQFNSAINRIKNTTNSLDSDIKKLKQSLKLDPTDMDAYGVYVDKLKSKINSLEDVYSSLEEEMYKGLAWGEIEYGNSKWIVFDNTLKNIRTTINDLKGEIDTTKNSLDGTSESIEKVDENANTLNSALNLIFKNDLVKKGINTLEKGLNKFGELLRKIIDGYTDLMKQGIEYNAEMEKYTVSLYAIANANNESTKSADRLITRMKKIGQTSSFSASVLLQASQQLMASGLSIQETSDSISNLQKLLAYAGKGDDELSRMAQNLNQIKNAGKATAQDLKQFAYAGIPVYKLLADYSDEFKEITKETVVQYEDLAAAFSVASDSSSQYFNANEIQLSTLSGQIGQLKSQWDMLLGALSTGTTDKLSGEILPTVNDFLGRLIKAIEDNEIVAENASKEMYEKVFYPKDVESVADVFRSGINDVIMTIIDSDILFDFLQVGVMFAEALNAAFDPETEEGRENLLRLEELINSLTDQIILFLDNVVPLFREAGKRIGGAVADGISEALASKIDPMWAEAFSGSFGSINGFGKSGGFGDINVRSGGFGALQSGGYGNQITLNASFVANGNLDEKQARRFASLMVEQINEELGVQL